MIRYGVSKFWTFCCTEKHWLAGWLSQAQHAARSVLSRPLLDN